MKNKRFSRVFAVALAIVMCFCMAVPAFAAGTVYTAMAADSLTSTTFDKYLVMKTEANVPNVSFNYSITKGSATTASNGKFAVSEGYGTPTISNNGVISFTSGSTTFATAQEGDYVKNLGTDEKYTKGSATVSFAGIVFPEPGVYRYIITEANPAKQGITYDSDLTRVLDVYVENASTSEAKLLKITGFVLHANETELAADAENFGTAANTAPANTAGSDYKSQGFTNKYLTYNLTFSKTVDGNQASRDKYFAFTVKIEGALPNTTYNVNLTNADGTSGTNAATIAANANKTNAAAITTDGSGTVTATFYLQHRQSIIIEGLTEGAVWTVTENEEDYRASVSVDGAAPKNASSATSDNADTDEKEGIIANTTVAFTNYREGVVPTGVLLTIAPFAILILAGIAGVIVILGRKKRASAE